MSLVAGAARADITPDPVEGTLMAGFGLGRRALGVLEPLEAGVLWLSDGQTSLALVSVDVIGLLSPTIARIRARVRDLAAPTDVVVAATHTHSGPDTMGLWGPGILGIFPRRSGVDPAYMDRLVEALADAVVRARDAARPAVARVASYEVPTHWTRNDRKGGGRFDRATALALDDASGARLATLLQFASHPEALWEHNRWISPDFPGAFRRRTRELAGGEALYVSGPLGGMLTPNVAPKATEAMRREYIEALGEALGDLTHDALTDVDALDAPSLGHTWAPVRLAAQNWRFRLMVRLGLVPYAFDGDGLTSEVHHIRLGDLEILTAPGELLPEVGHEVDGLMSAPHRMIVGLAGDELGYVLQDRMFDEREYRYERAMSLGRDTAATLVAAYRQMLGSA